MLLASSIEPLAYVLIAAKLATILIVVAISRSVISLLRLLRFGQRRPQHRRGILLVPQLLVGITMLAAPVCLEVCRPGAHNSRVTWIISIVFLLVAATTLLKVFFVAADTTEGGIY